MLCHVFPCFGIDCRNRESTWKTEVRRTESTSACAPWVWLYSWVPFFSVIMLFACAYAYAYLGLTSFSRPRSCRAVLWGEVAFCIPAEPISAVCLMFPALRVRPVHAAAIVVDSGPVLHETFKSPMIAIGKIHVIPSFPGEFGFCSIYEKCVSP